MIHDEYLRHHGIKNQKWGVRNGPPYPLNRNRERNILKGTEHQNISKWGSDKDHNILYVTGLSGSGKSTIATKIDSNAKVIHLDRYIEAIDWVKKGSIINYENKDFSTFVNKRDPELIYNIRSTKSGIKRYSNEWIKNVDKLMEYSEKFAQKQYPKNKVVVEGIQLMDNTVYPDKKFFRDKPVITTSTNTLISMYRASKRDGVSFKERLENGNEYIRWYVYMNVTLQNFKNSVYFDSGKMWLDEKMRKA